MACYRINLVLKCKSRVNPCCYLYTMRSFLLRLVFNIFIPHLALSIFSNSSCQVCQVLRFVNSYDDSRFLVHTNRDIRCLEVTESKHAYDTSCAIYLWSCFTNGSLCSATLHIPQRLRCSCILCPKLHLHSSFFFFQATILLSFIFRSKPSSNLNNLKTAELSPSQMGKTQYTITVSKILALMWCWKECMSYMLEKSLFFSLLQPLVWLYIPSRTCLKNTRALQGVTGTTTGEYSWQ